MSHWFACEIEEIVRPRGAKQPTVRRVERGFARGEAYGGRGFSIDAGTEPFDDVARSLGDALARLPVPDIAAVPSSVAVRVLTRAAAVSTGGEITRDDIRIVVLSSAELSVVATPESLTADLQLLASLGSREAAVRADPDSLPIAWQNGSAAVLFHEAIGHPAERGLHAPSIPSWLTVCDSPASGEIVRMSVDDIGEAIGTEELTAGAAPAAFRRWTYRDVPARRLTNLVATAAGTPLPSLPDTRIDALLVDEGWWDPATDTFGVRVVAADLVEATRRTPLAPFVYTARRDEFFPLIAGWFGSVTRHPGVLCGDEGVSLPVGSASPGIVTEAR